MALSSRMTAAPERLALDPQGVESLRRTAKRDPDAAVREVAKQFEALLMQQMLNSMRQANQGFSQENQSSFGLFRSMQDQQFAQLSARQGGLGLADAIVRQINAQRSALAAKAGQPSAVDGEAARKVTLPVETGKPLPQATRPAKAAALPVAAAGEFVGQMNKAAEGAAASLGLSPHLLVAQAALETGWGKRAIRSADGRDSHNLFGIKAGPDWPGKSVDVLTTEYVDGKAQKRVERFRAYDSHAAAFADYAGLIKRRYGAALGLGEDAAGFGQALQSGGYATDPHYASKINQVAERVARQLAAHQTGSTRQA